MSSMNDCRPWTQKSAPGILYGQAEDARSMLLFATGFKCPRAGKKHKPAARRCLWRIIVKGAVAKVSTRRLRADGATSGRAYGRADVGAAHVWRRAAARVWAAYGYKIGSIRRRAYGRANSAPTASRAYASGTSSPAGRSFLLPSSRFVKFSGHMGRA